MSGLWEFAPKSLKNVGILKLVPSIVSVCWIAIFVYISLICDVDTWAWLLKSIDVFSEGFFKISNVNISNTPIFFVEKV